MRRNNGSIVLSLLFVVLLAGNAAAQLLSPLELRDPLPQKLQQQYWSELKLAAGALEGHRFPFPFYFSRTLDIDEQQQRRLPQGSIRFDHHEGHIVLAITGNYYASYSAEVMDNQQRAKQTFSDVLLPLLKAMVPPFAQNESFTVYAIEVSHHVRRKVLGVETESPENVVLLMPNSAARKLVSATNPEEQQSAMLEAEMYLDGEPLALWLSGDTAPAQPARREKHAESRGKKTIEVASLEPVASYAAPAPTVSEKLYELPVLPVHIVTPGDLAVLQHAQAATLAKLRSDLDAQAHFVAYAPPSFVEFHNLAELQLSVETTLPASDSGSHYKMAALAFDEHIAHLVRPVVAYFSGDPGFNRVDFSTTVRAGSAPPVSVEFILSLNAMRCFAEYNCTGQQLINAGLVLINGERAGLQLQAAAGER